jgi:hypothetical protein
MSEEDFVTFFRRTIICNYCDNYKHSCIKLKTLSNVQNTYLVKIDLSEALEQAFFIVTQFNKKY